MTFHTQVVGANGQRQAMFIERDARPGRGHPRQLPLRAERRDDGVLGQRPDRRAGRDGPGRSARGLRVIAVTSVAQSMSGEPEPAAGSRLLDEADLVIDLCTPARRRPRRRSRARHAGRPGLTIGGRRHRQFHQGPHRRAPRGARGDATGHHPGLGRGRRAVAGRCSTMPIESMRGASPVRSTSEEVGDARRPVDATHERSGGPSSHRGASPAVIEEECDMNQFGKARRGRGLGAIALIGAACSGGGGATTAPSQAAGRARPRRGRRRRRQRAAERAASERGRR